MAMWISTADIECMNAAQYCKERGVTISELSRELEVDRSTLYRWYHSRSNLFVVLVDGYTFGNDDAIKTRMIELLKTNTPTNC
jgi:AcrR family transcriptional regulator